jgi:hypothetical protein
MKFSPLVFATTAVLVSQVSAGFFSALGCGVLSLGVAGGCHATLTVATGGLGLAGCHALAMGTLTKCAAVTVVLP